MTKPLKAKPADVGGLAEQMNRRDWLCTAGWGCLALTGVVTTVASVRFFFPNVVYETPAIFKAGMPDIYPRGSVTFLSDHRIFILRDSKGLRALSAVCTHLRCTVNWDDANGTFVCPCHGSRFDRQGVRMVGPAPKDLSWYTLRLASDRQVIVDTTKAAEVLSYLRV